MIISQEIMASFTFSVLVVMHYIGDLNISTTGDITLGVVRGNQMSLTCNRAFLKAKVMNIVRFYVDLHICL